jgi:uncharacterized protein YkwD
MSLLVGSGPAFAQDLTREETAVLRAMNAVRTTHRLPRLRIDRRLQRAARSHSADMLRRQYFAHGTLLSRLVRFGAHGAIFGEDLAWGPQSARWVVGQWLASPEHRANLLRRRFRRVGVGAYTGTFAGHAGAFVVTADFAGR